MSNKITFLALALTMVLGTPGLSSAESKAQKKDSTTQSAPAKPNQEEMPGGCMPDGGCCGGGACAGAAAAQGAQPKANDAPDEGGCPCQKNKAAAKKKNAG